MDAPEKTAEGAGATDWDDKVRLFSVVIACDGERRQLRALHDFAHLSNRAPDSALFAVVPVLVDLLRSSPPAILKATAFALSRLARRPGAPFCPIIAQFGAIPLVVGLLPESTNGFRRSLLRLLSALVAFDAPSRATLARNRGLNVVLDLLSSCSDDSKRYLLEILSGMAMLREVRRVVTSLGALPFLIEAVSVGRMVSRMQAAHAIGLLGVGRMVSDSSVILALVRLIREGDQAARLTAGNALGIISSHADYICPVVEAGAIPLYMELLEGNEPLGREIAEDVFCVLAVAEENAAAIAEQLVRVLHGCNEEARLAAVDLFWDLAGYKHSVSVVRDSGAIPLLIEVLRNGNVDISEKVMGTIAQLSYDEANRGALVEAGGITLLIDLLRGDSEELRDYAAEALINFGEDPVFRELIVDVFNIPSFLDAVRRLRRIRIC